jgi:hypothetical protein
MPAGCGFFTSGCWIGDSICPERGSYEPVDQEIYGSYEEEARERLRGRDENDWTILASAFRLAADVWAEDADFLGTGVAVWTTNRIESFLRSQNALEEG